MTSPTGTIVDAYLRRLGDELRDLPRARREELVAEIGDHIEEARAEQAAWDEAGIRNVLDQIGDPADIAAEARERFGVHPREMGTREIFAILMMTIGGFFLPFLGWLVGAALMWGSRAWTRREKWVGTLLFPGGFGSAWLVMMGSSEVCFGSEPCVSEHSSLENTLFAATLALSLLGTIGSAIYLSVRARRGARVPAH